jgi:DNA-binding MurR/RpiR family transcriptional regulator
MGPGVSAFQHWRGRTIRGILVPCCRMANRGKNEKRSIVVSQISQTERLARLSPRRREIVRPALEDPRQFVLLSVRDLAKKLGTDPATTVRIARAMAFESYKEFQMYLHELSVARATSLETMRSAPAEGSTTSLLQASLDHELKNLRALYNVLDLKRVAAVAKRIWKARRVLLLGGDVAASLVTYLEYHLRILGLPVSSATMPGMAVHTVRSLGKNDVVIAISFRRGLRMTVEGLEQARRQGAYCVGITDTYVSPITRFANEVYLASVDSLSFSASYAAPMALLNLFLVACAEDRHLHTLEIMKKVDEEQRRGFRWYEA